MPIGLFPALLALAIIVTLASAYYLLMNARTVAAIFSRSDNEIAPGSGRRRASRGRVAAAALLFVGGTLACLLIWTITMSGGANEVLESRPEEVQRP